MHCFSSGQQFLGKCTLDVVSHSVNTFQFIGKNKHRVIDMLI